MEIEVVAPDDGGAAGLANHLAEGTDAHDASAISISDAAGDFTATEVEGALAELQADAETDALALAEHIADPTDAHDASAISFIPTGSISADNVQDAIIEAAAEGGGGGGGGSSFLVDLLDVTGVPPVTGEAPVWDGDSFELTDVATQAELTAHIDDADDAHDASAISLLDTAADFTATNVEDALAELQAADEADEAALAAHIGDTADAHDASAISADSTTLAGTGTDVQAVLEELDNAIVDHIADTADAHDASAISLLDTGGHFTATEVESALEELATAVAEAADENLILHMEVFA